MKVQGKTYSLSIVTPHISTFLEFAIKWEMTFKMVEKGFKITKIYLSILDESDRNYLSGQFYSLLTKKGYLSAILSTWFLWSISCLTWILSEYPYIHQALDFTNVEVFKFDVSPLFVPLLLQSRIVSSLAWNNSCFGFQNLPPVLLPSNTHSTMVSLGCR